MQAAPAAAHGRLRHATSQVVLLNRGAVRDDRGDDRVVQRLGVPAPVEDPERGVALVEGAAPLLRDSRDHLEELVAPEELLVAADLLAKRHPLDAPIRNLL